MEPIGSGGLTARESRLLAFEIDGLGGWLFSLAAFMVAFGLRYALNLDLPIGFPYLTFFPAVIITTFVAGLWPGIANATAGGIAAWYFFIAPFGSFALTGNTALALGFYIFIVSTDIAILHLMSRALHRLKEERHRSAELAKSREFMFSELQHRVSNNLQVVASLMQMQKRRIADPEAVKIVEEGIRRLQLVSKIQRALHNPSGQRMPLNDFLREMVTDVIDANGAHAGITHSVTAQPEARDVILTNTQSIPVGLIATELVANCLEHGFAGRDHGHIAIEVARGDDGMVVLTIRDNGNGIPDDFDLTQTRSLGMQIARSFALQLGGELTLTKNDGTEARLIFSEAEDEGVLNADNDGVTNS